MSEQPDDSVLFNDMINALNQAIGGASQLLHLKKDPRWLLPRETLEDMKGRFVTIAERYAMLTMAGIQ